MCVQEMRLMVREEVAEHVSGNRRALAVMGEAHGGKLPGQVDSHGLVLGLETSSSLDIHSLWGMLAETVIAIKYMFVLFFILVPVFIVEFVKIK